MVARGEMVLENMLRNIREYWNNFEIELVRYQTKCKLIKGFDELFQKLDEDISNL
jgi:dynein heavy chain 1